MSHSDERHERGAPRIVLAKVGLDGHDRGIKVVARGLRDAGFHVIYAGIWQSPAAVARAVVDEDADWLGLSLLSGAHMTLVPRVLAALQSAGADRTRVVVGGIVPDEDVPKLHALGVAHVFGPGTSIDEITHRLASVTAPDSSPAATVDAEAVLAAAQQRDRQLLARLITRAARAGRCDPLWAAQPAGGDTSRVVAVTGSGGVGKSTLVGRLIQLLRTRHRTVAVLACDPESPLTGGALLGDRGRITIDPADDGLFVRSLAAPSGRQSIADHLEVMVALTKAFGFDVVLLETAGAGQGDTAVGELADVVAVLLQPESGDEMQWQKAGLLEIADVVVVHKADLPGADRMAAELHEQLNLPGCRTVPVVRVSAQRGDGIDDLWQAIDAVGRR